MAKTSSPSTSVVDDLSKNSNQENVVYQVPSAAGSLLNNTNTSNKIQYQSQIESRNNAASTQPFVNLQLSQTSSIGNIETYKGWSIFNILCCCLSLGCIAFAFSREAANLIEQRNIQGALKASKRARNLNIIGTISGIIILILAAVHFFSHMNPPSSY
jgi:hypothetical protein